MSLIFFLVSTGCFFFPTLNLWTELVLFNIAHANSLLRLMNSTGKLETKFNRYKISIISTIKLLCAALEPTPWINHSFTICPSLYKTRRGFPKKTKNSMSKNQTNKLEMREMKKNQIDTCKRKIRNVFLSQINKLRSLDRKIINKQTEIR